MSLLSDIQTILGTLSPSIPCEVGVFSSRPAPDTYCVISHCAETFKSYDDKIDETVSQATIELYTKGNYTAKAHSIMLALNSAGICITSGEFIEREADTGYNHYSIDIENNYKFNTN